MVCCFLPRPGQPDGRERGSISIFLATSAFCFIMLVGVAVDLTGQVHAQQYARDIAAEAARVGGQQLEVTPAIQGTNASAAAAQAAQAAQAYLAAADNITGSASVTGGTIVTVTTSSTYRTRFLSIVGLNQMTVTGSAQARVTRSVGGVEQ